MIRPVCMSCHGLGYSVDALADAALVLENFLGKPRVHIKSHDMVGQRVKEAEEHRRMKGGAPEEKK